jgi:dihydropteroate synthase
VTIDASQERVGMTHRSWLAGVSVGEGAPVAVMGALNVSPESFYTGSVVAAGDALLRAAETMARAGAAIVDVGAMSTAPYLVTRISEQEEADRLAWSIGHLRGKLDVPISADTSRLLPARAALEAGARLVNDVSGLTAAPELARAVAEARAGLIVMAAERPGMPTGDPIDVVSGLLAESIELARAGGVPPEAIAVDPGIGFFRRGNVPWHEWDCAVLADLDRLRALGFPIAVGVSRKSFIGAITGEPDPSHRLPGSLAATAAAVLHGAHLIRTHDVPETLQAVRLAEAIRTHTHRRHAASAPR